MESLQQLFVAMWVQYFFSNLVPRKKKQIIAISYVLEPSFGKKIVVPKHSLYRY